MGFRDLWDFRVSGIASQAPGGLKPSAPQAPPILGLGEFFHGFRGGGVGGWAQALCPLCRDPP